MDERQMLFILAIFSGTLACCLSTPTVRHDATDRSALLTFKNGITSDPNEVMSSWNHTTPLCKWEGVVCGRKHQEMVTQLRLGSRGLSGTISSAIGNLTFFRKLDLSGNGFYGKIPSEVGFLFRLKDFRLSNNSLHGSIPAAIARCSELIFMEFSHNQLSGPIPSEFGSLAMLEHFGARNNSLTGTIPSSFGNLSSLVWLDVPINHLQGSIPTELGRLRKLTHFQVSLNMLNGTFPSSIFNISSLELISVTDNDLYGKFPANIGTKLPNLKYMMFGGNKFSGSVPVWLSNITTLSMVDLPNNSFSGPVLCEFGRLPNLYYLNLGGNQLEAHDAMDWRFLDTLTNCSQLQVLILTSNRFGGVLPASVANLSKEITEISMDMNQIRGNLPSGIVDLINLNTLRMDDNFLAGSIPLGIGKLNKLQRLSLSNNSITGNIPSSIGNLSQVLLLDLSINELNGLIPSSMGNLQNLEVLDLSNNNLTGSIPKELLRISSLSQFLDLSSNSLSGHLPDIGHMNNLVGFAVTLNKLSGKIPSTLANCESLQILSMAMNKFEGPIPLSLSKLKGLEFLDLADNNLTGTIPAILQNLTFLYHLKLSFNDLEGPVPTEGVFRNASGIMLSGNDRLCGGIPEIKLPACSKRVQSNKRKGKETWFKIVIPVAAIILSLIVFFVLRKKATAQSRNSIRRMPLSDQFPMVSYRSLEEATNHFAPANQIGQGRFSSVYKGSLTLSGRDLTVAIKVLKLQVKGSSRSFFRECKTLQSVRHRNLLKILTLCSSLDFGGNEFKALVFEFMPNGSLDSWLHPQEESSHALSLIQMMNIAIDIAEALEYLHHSCEPPLVHCDLKPSNVLLDNDMVAHVADFGLAKFLSTITSTTDELTSSTNPIRGTIGYVAPEYGAGGAPSRAGDVYSYGILLLEMVTGKRPVDDTFRDGLTLRSFAEMHASPDQIMEIANNKMFDSECGNGNNQLHGVLECLLSIVQVGLQCSKEAANERMDMVIAAKKMNLIRDMYLGNRTPAEGFVVM